MIRSRVGVEVGAEEGAGGRRVYRAEDEMVLSRRSQRA